MGTSIAVRGRLAPSIADPIAALEPLLSAPGPLAARAERGTDEEGRPFCGIAIHPAAEPLRITDLGGGGVSIEAITGTAGPGYHQHACARIAAAIEASGLAIEHTDDESGYFSSRDRRALERATEQWLRPTAMEILSLHARGYRGLQLSMPEGTIVEAAGGIVATPLGPRDHAWLVEVSRHPKHGIDALPWWLEGEGAEMLRGAARAAMWLEVRWRRPILARERELGERIVDWLERALAIEPEGDHPWREHAELYDLLGEDSLRATRARLRASNLPPAAAIGYRRSPVRVSLTGGWSLRIPGEMAEEWDDRGAFAAWDPGRSIWFTSLEARGSDDTARTLAGLPELEGEGDLLGFERGAIRALARFETSEHEGRIATTMRAYAALGSHAAIGTIVLERASDRDWALETWASLAHIEDRAQG